MISPLIKWDHSEDRFVTRYEAKSSKSERLYTINISDQEYEFVTGHTIDGLLKFLSSRAIETFAWFFQGECFSQPLVICSLFGTLSLI